MAKTKIQVTKGAGINLPNSETKQSIVLQNIIVRPIERSSQDIEKWRRALKHAEGVMGNRVELYDLYEDIMLDGHLSSVVEKRVNNITNGHLVFLDKDGQEVTDITDYIDTLSFEALLKEIILTKMWGFTVLEFDPKTRHWTCIPRKHIRPRSQEIVVSQHDTDGFSYVQPPYNRYVVEIGEREDLGLLLKAAQYVIYKRGNFGDWAQFAEIFGMPFREARYDGFDNATRVQLEQAMERAGGAAYAILPKEAEFKIHANNSTGSKDLYEGLSSACNKEISKTILGNTETTESSSSSGHAQASVHADTEDDIYNADRRYVTRVLKEKILPILAMHGFQVENGYFSYPDKRAELPMDKEVTMLKELSGMIPISHKYLYEKFGIPEPEAGEAVVENSPSPMDIMLGGKDNNPRNKPIKDNSRDDEDDDDEDNDPRNVNLAMKALKSLQAFFRPARKPPVTELVEVTGDLRAEIELLYGSACEHCAHDIQLNEDGLQAMVASLISDVWARKLQEGWSRKAAMKMAEELMAGVFEGYGMSIATAPAVDYAMLTALESNVFQFSAAKSYTMTQELTALLSTPEGIRSFESFRGLASEKLERFVGSWIKTEYNQAVATAQMSSKWVEVQATKATLPNLTYSAVMDGRTRPEHRKMHNITRPIDDPFWKQYYPPNDWGCRCNAIATSMQRVTTPDEIRLKQLEPAAAGFDKNLAAEGKIFPESHPYYKNVPPSVMDAINELKPKRDAGS
jgi:SPP1 gp7 family putative phage head morphogenesis protein